MFVSALLLLGAWHRVDVEIETTSDWTRVAIEGGFAWVESAVVEPEGHPGLELRGLLVIKNAWDGTAVTVQAGVWIYVDESEVRVTITKGNLGTARVVIRQEEVLLDEVNATVTGDGRNPLTFTLDASRLTDDGEPPAVARERRAEPVVLAFYYPWYGPGIHWDPERRTSTNTPTLGWYDSRDRDVIAQHIEWAQAAGVDGFIASWWGPGDFTDEALEAVLEVADERDFRVTAYVEESADYTGQIEYLRDRYGARESWLRQDDRPVVFVYARVVGELGWDGLANRPTDVFLVGDTLDPRGADVFDGLHTYNPAFDDVAELVGRMRSLADADALLAATVVPGYDDTAIREPGGEVPRSDGLTYDRFWEAARLSSPDWVLITSWNEWHEGTEIEPSEEHGEAYLEHTRRRVEGWRD